MLFPGNWLFDLARNRKAKQVASLYSSMVLGIFIGIGISIVNTRLLGPKLYGDFKFLLNLFSFVITLLTFGLFYSAGRLLTQKKYQNQKKALIGNAVIISSFISILFIIILLGFSFIEEDIFNNQLGGIIRIFLPLLFIFPFQLCCENLLQGDNRIYLLSAFRLGPKILYFIVALVYNYFIPLSLISALTLHFSTIGILILITIIRLEPEFKNIKSTFSIILNENKTYGFQVFIGAIAGMASAHLGGLSIGYFIDNTNVGFFSLAITATMPLAMIPNAIGITFFKDFASMQFIPRRVFLISFILSLFSLFVFLLFIKEIVILFYTEEYSAVIPLAYIVSIGSTFHGLGDFFNRFLAAHGKGKELRNSNISIGICNVLGYVILVYYLGISGAAITKILAGIIYFGMMIYYYRKYLSRTRND